MYRFAAGSKNGRVSEYTCCGTGMTTVVVGNSDGETRVVRLCPFCELRLIQIELPAQRPPINHRLGVTLMFPTQRSPLESFESGPRPQV